ncbi:Fic/DOC family protein [Subtercola boreus]|uniref:protein adenylyltransferase n=1 Tax=Subtercola boreus TaxID=120213 RepID=A0A3E0WAF6_9MICO|nr:Fic family protein [Subtercola boreus]RFA18780.1 hypothetical protein B7R24_13630 [Subtercola boreus]RFA18896.1 hypothetical protein B7R23_13620 [Subtercola boreus]RFA25432.1 hypothetical protein B7R25_13730 [Subtercola boreus]
MMDARVRYCIDSADAAMAFVNIGSGDRRHRLLVDRVAAEELPAGQAVEQTARHFGLTIDRSNRPPVRSFDDYLLPGSFALRSRLVDPAHPDGIDDSGLLNTVEHEISRLRLVELALRPVSGDYGYEHARVIHGRIFGDVWHWAGSERVGPGTAMTRFAPDTVGFAPGDASAPMISYRYFAGPEIAEAASVQFAQLSHLSTRTDLGRRRVLDLISEYGGELNAIHPFRDGNMRTLWAYAAQLEAHMGYPIDVAGFLKTTAAHHLAMHSAYHFQATNDNGVMFRLMDSGLGE